MIKKFIRQWLCEHNITTGYRKIESIVSHSDGKKDGKWVETCRPYCMVERKCKDCGKLISFTIKN